MLKELREHCEQHMKEHDSCYRCPNQEQCGAFQDLRTMIVGRVQSELFPWEMSDHFVEYFDELIGKLGGEQNV